MKCSRCWLETLFLGIVVLAFVAGCTASPTPAPPTATPKPTVAPEEEAAALVAAAEEHFRNSRLEESVEEYEAALKVDPDNVPALAGLSLAYSWLSAEDEQALEYAEQAVESDPESVMAQSALATALLKQWKGEEAIEAATAAAELAPEDAGVQALLARSYLMDLRYEEALETAERAYEMAPDSARVHYALSAVYLFMDDFPRAAFALERAADLEPSFAPWHSALGNYLFERERFTEAIAAYEEALALNPDDPYAHLALMSLALQQHDVEAAEERLAALEEAFPDHPVARSAHGQLLSYHEDYDAALEIFEELAEEEPADPDVLMSIASIHLRRQKCDPADDIFRDFMDLYPNWPSAIAGRGWVALCEGDPGDALDYFRDALEISPYNGRAHLGASIAYDLQGRFQEADEERVEALRSLPAPSWVHYYLGSALLEVGDLAGAEAEYRLSLRLNPYNIESRLGLAMIHAARSEDEQALNAVEEALELQPDNRQALRQQGLLKAGTGEMEEASALLETYLEEEPDDAQVHYFLALAYLEEGENEQAQQHLQIAQGLGYGKDDWQAQQHLTLLQGALDQGYVLSEARFLEQFEEQLEMLELGVREIEVEEDEEGLRTLFVTLNAADDDDATSAVLVIGMGATLVPRVEPPLDGGVRVEVARGSRVLFEIEVGLQAIKLYNYGILTPQGFAASLDITNYEEHAALLADMQGQISELRGLEASGAVPHEIITRDELRANLSEGLDPAASEVVDPDESTLILLGALDPEADLGELMVDLQTEQLAGYYDIQEKNFYMVESDALSVIDELVITHEYVHALQDQNFGLEVLTDTTGTADSRLAYRALVEGDATLATLL